MYVVQKTSVLLDNGITVTFFDPSDIYKLGYSAPFFSKYGFTVLAVTFDFTLA